MLYIGRYTSTLYLSTSIDLFVYSPIKLVNKVGSHLHRSIHRFDLLRCPPWHWQLRASLFFPPIISTRAKSGASPLLRIFTSPPFALHSSSFALRPSLLALSRLDAPAWGAISIVGYKWDVSGMPMEGKCRLKAEGTCSYTELPPRDRISPLFHFLKPPWPK